MSHPYTAATKAHTSRIPAHVAIFRKRVGDHFGFTRTEVVRDASRCAQQASRHCQCEAIDFFTTDLSPQGRGRRLFEWCHIHGHDLDIQAVIFNKRVVGFGRWNEGERPYTGNHPHTDHVHVEFNNRAQTTLTEVKVMTLLAKGDDMPSLDEIRAVVREEVNAKVVASEWQFHKPRYSEILKAIKAVASGSADAEAIVDEIAERLARQGPGA